MLATQQSAAQIAAAAAGRASDNFNSHSNFRVKSNSRSPERSSSLRPQRPKSQEQLKKQEQQTPTDFTEVFSWGSDRYGQLGLGPQMSAGKALHNLPRFCSYNIPIHQIACGEQHAAFITTTSLCYTMGHNNSG